MPEALLASDEPMPAAIWDASELGALSRWERTSKRTRAIRRATTFGKEAKAKLAAEDDADALPPQLTPTETALKQDGIEDQGERP